MRLFRWLLPVAITAIAVTVAWLYVEQRRTLAENAPKAPELLPKDVQYRTSDSCITQSLGDKPRFRACFEKSEQIDKRLQLYGVRMEVFKDDGSFDLIEYKTALFDQESKKLYSDGAVEITLGVPPDAPPGGRLLRIHAIGVEFDNETLRLHTDRDVRFDFEQGGGSAVGAYYDPSTRELRMDSNVVLDWHGRSPEAVPMHIESGQAWYFEAESKVLLFPWAKLTRANLTMDGGPSEMFLVDGAIQRAEMQGARGVQTDPKRKVEFAAEFLRLGFAEKMQIQKVDAEKDAHLISTSETARTTVSGTRLDLAFQPGEDSSTLTSAVSTGKSRVEVAPVARANGQLPDTRVLQSEVIRMAMRPGGEEIERIETDGAGTLDFLPNRPNQPKRFLEGDRIWIDYAPENKIRQFRSINAKTRTERPDRAPMLTASEEILAHFDPATSELTRLEQNRAFTYQEGDRRANANRAVLEQAANRITLDGAARSSDPSGSVNADKIVLDQRTNDFIAEGRVTTVREPKARANGMLSGKQVLQASANRMVSTQNGQKIHYEGNAQAWQGSDRVQADVLDIDQEHGVMQARGKVMTQITEKPKAGQPATKSNAKPIFTVVRASNLTYTEASREAFYEGGVTLERPALTVDSHTLRAFLTADSSLEKAFADGAVKIVSTELSTQKEKRIRTGASEHAEYFTAEQKVRLTGGRPRVTDSAREASSEGEELIWWAGDDRVLVNGAPEQPARTTFKKK